MRIVLSGGTGFLGRPLAAALRAAGHQMVVLPRAQTGWAKEIDGAGAIVNLAGESIAARRWSDAHKARILDSRLNVTRTIVNAIRDAASPPPVLISGSAVGYYGPLSDEIATEDTPPGSDFLASVCAQWEAEAMRAADRVRVVCVRTGLALERDGGARPRAPSSGLHAGARVRIAAAARRDGGCVAAVGSACGARQGAAAWVHVSLL